MRLQCRGSFCIAWEGFLFLVLLVGGQASCNMFVMGWYLANFHQTDSSCIHRLDIPHQEWHLEEHLCEST